MPIVPGAADGRSDRISALAPPGPCSRVCRCSFLLLSIHCARCDHSPSFPSSHRLRSRPGRAAAWLRPVPRALLQAALRVPLRRLAARCDGRPICDFRPTASRAWPAWTRGRAISASSSSERRLEGRSRLRELSRRSFCNCMPSAVRCARNCRLPLTERRAVDVRLRGGHLAALRVRPTSMVDALTRAGNSAR